MMVPWRIAWLTRLSKTCPDLDAFTAILQRYSKSLALVIA
jgi:hypothetical protein